MRSAAVAFLLGTVAVLLLPALPSPGAATWALLAAALLGCAARATRPLGFLLLGALHAGVAAEGILATRLPETLHGRDLVVEGVVRGIPQADANRTRFRLLVHRAGTPAGEPAGWGEGALLRLSWYSRGERPAAEVRAGQAVRLLVRLRPPRGLTNAAGFDYERWLFTQRVAATGYVRRSLGESSLPPHRFSALRGLLLGRLSAASGELRRAGLLAALVLGERGGVDEATWALMRATGTGHLMAISGLHVGMLALLAFWLARRLWVLSPGLTRRLPARRAAALAAGLVGCGYAALAGFSLPTQRALAMVAVVMLALWSRRRTPPSAALALALLVVLALDPLASLSGGFWLSFGATAVLLYLAVGRRPPPRRLLSALPLQLGLTLGLAPILLAVFGHQPLLAPLANLLAIPWTGWLVVPLSLLGALLAWLGLPAGAVLAAADACGAVLLAWLGWLASVGDGAQWHLAPSTAAVAAALVGVLALLAPAGFGLRWLGLLWLAPLLASAPPPLPQGALRVRVLDVGQGLAALVMTRGHALLYDAGPRYRGGFDSGRSVVLPVLRAEGRAALDTMVLSHANADHTGGAAAVMTAQPGLRVLHNATLAAGPTTPCVAGVAWRWDGYDFRVLHPPAAGRASVDNDGSCVVHVSGPGGSVLLPGDLEAAGEALLLAGGASLRADVLVVPHHGSRSSSTPRFVEAVSPRVAVFATGHRNRYGFPVPEVAARLSRAGAQLHDTGEHGAIEIDLRPGSPSPLVRRLRVAERAIWRPP